jgi:ubiquinone/menaquinone biosynthesis C-methylase UbiE
MNANVLSLLACPTCQAPALTWDADALRCAGEGGCQSRYPNMNGILDLTPRVTVPLPETPYQSERLSDLIAGAYDRALPLMSAALWGCSAMRFVDWAHMAVGRARGGYHLAFPIDTGKLYAHIWGAHLADVGLVVADTSWKMLRRAQRKLKRAKIPCALIARVDPARLPFRGEAFQSVLSLNGMHHFPERDAAWRSLLRVTSPSGLLAGSTLIREPHRMLAKLFSWYDRAGITPQPHSKDFVLAELSALGASHWFFETYGAVMFFGVEVGAGAASADTGTVSETLCG